MTLGRFCQPRVDSFNATFRHYPAAHCRGPQGWTRPGAGRPKRQVGEVSNLDGRKTGEVEVSRRAVACRLVSAALVMKQQCFGHRWVRSRDNGAQTANF